MYFEPQVEEKDFPSILRRFISIIGWERWKKRIRWVVDQSNNTLVMPGFWTERFELELAMFNLIKIYKHRSKINNEEFTPAVQRFISFASMTVFCHRRLSSQGKRRLKGMLLSALNSDYGLGPLAYEMAIAAHLMSKRFDVTFNDIETGGGFDFLAQKNSTVLEVECKFVSADIGRQIHLKRLCQFGDSVMPQLNRYTRNADGGIFVHLSIPGKLYGNSKHHSTLLEIIFKGIERKADKIESDGNKVAISQFDVAQSPFSSNSRNNIYQGNLEKFVYDKFSISNKNFFSSYVPNKSALILVIESEKQNNVLDSLYRQLKKSANEQFSSKNPAILCAHLVDIEETELLALKNKGDSAIGLDYLSTRLILGRPYLHSISFSAPGSIREISKFIGNMSQQYFREAVPAYTIANPNHAFADNVEYSIF